MRDALITLLNESRLHEMSSDSVMDSVSFVPAPVRAPRIIDCAVMGAYDLRELIEDVMQMSTHDETEWAACRTKGDALRFALHRIMATDIGRALAMDVRFEQWSCDVVDEDEPAQLTLSQKQITIPLPCAHISHLSRVADYKSMFILSVFESLRRLWHVNVGAPQSHAWQFTDLLLWNRCLRADLDVMTIVFAYQDRTSGGSDLWRFLLSSPLADMASSYMNACAVYGADQNQDEHTDLLADLYLSWFYDEARVNQTDHLTLSALDYALTHTSAIGIVGTNALTTQDIMALSLYPQGGAPYLEVMASEILLNPDYKEFRSDIMLAHAEQIEQDLMEESLHISNLLVFRDPHLSRLFSVDMVS